MTGTDFFGFEDGAAVLITGAASGIGRATALLAGDLGLAVAAWDRDEAGLETLVSEGQTRGRTIVPAVVDISHAEQVGQAMADGVQALDCRYLVNNAGPAQGTDLSFAQGIGAGLGSYGLVTETWLELSCAREGALVNVASVAGNLQGTGQKPWYPAAKAGIAGYTRWLAVRRPQGVRANAVLPGSTRTARTVDRFATPEGAAHIARIPIGRAGEPLDIARAILFLLAPASEYINGACLPVDGAMSLVW